MSPILFPACYPESFPFHDTRLQVSNGPSVNSGAVWILEQPLRSLVYTRWCVIGDGKGEGVWLPALT